MYKVLINAYACSPEMGREPGMAWNWCVNLAKFCELFIITEGEFRDKIEAVLPTLKQGRNMHFYYNPVSEKIRRMCWNQGDWRFYWYYHQWQKKTLVIAKRICDRQKISIIHQLNMIGFREPGLLWKIEGPKYVWGPIGGLFNIPSNYLWSISKKEVFKNILKKSISDLQIRYYYAVRRAIARANLLIGATNKETETIQSLYKKTVFQINETGSTILKNEMEHVFSQDENFNLIWVGRFIPTKQLGLALKVMAKLKKQPQIKLHIVGTGAEAHFYMKEAIKLGLDKTCIWYGQIDNKKVLEMMRTSDLFFFTSIAEATSTVILEAISAKLPIVCFDTCGFGPIVNEKIGRNIQISNPQQSIREFSEVIRDLYLHRELLPIMSENCEERQRELSW